ncbi:ATPase, T2SS/T4P/T4SS family [Microbacterium testaceum]|uniref:ATPase, T2SS/T4P/T4SS family n=1 Tax=Microbacterium testaceum TaxID=2033 RepID=UPI002AC6B275|nr:ATPase, T2SS/T4P/T4SS family [Microbacterium testaceum]MDZ5146344.1 ATPase, T2SS/T4P/T4SS family [Microbacterium testaceum]
MVQIRRIIERRATRIVQERGSDHDWSPLQRGHYAQAIFDQAHRYGRLQQFLREDDVEEISIVGHDNVIVTKGSGKKERRPAVACTDDELEQTIAEMASYRDRTFARPAGDIDLDIGGARISATGRGKTSVTNLSIRKHNHVDITLSDMVANRTTSAAVADFLTAASRANCCVFVAGFPGTGKTTLVRALTSTIPPEEKIVTIETEHELYLNKLPHRHWQVMDLQYVPSQAAGADSAGGFTLQACLDKALRAGSERIIFAEIKSIEGPIAMKAMQAGKGSMSTIHARSADDAIHRFADVLMGELGLSDDTVPLRQILRSIDVIVYVDIIPNPDGTRRRVITEVTEVRPTDKGEPMAAQLFRYDPATDDYLTPEVPTTQLNERLLRVGYDFSRRGRHV